MTTFELDAVKAAIRQIDEFADFPFSIDAKPTNGGPKNYMRDTLAWTEAFSAKAGQFPRRNPPATGGFTSNAWIIFPPSST